MSIRKMTEYRGIWMGFGMLWIMLFHSGMFFPVSAMNFIKNIGYGGVDIFLFASGLGNYYSYMKDEAPLPFIKRRLKRLVPVYIPFIIGWCICKLCTGKLVPMYVLGNLLGVQVLSSAGASFNWYLAVLIICYLLTPYFASFVKTHDLKGCLQLICFLILVSTAFWNDQKFIISMTRLPIYVIGMVFAKEDSRVIEVKTAVCGAIATISGFVILYECFRHFPDLLWPYGLYWYPFILITPFLCYFISLAASRIEKNRITNALLKVIGLIGKYSFEIFLVHVFVFEELRPVWKLLDIQIPLNNYVWLGAFLVSFLGAWILHVAAEAFMKKQKASNE